MEEAREQEEIIDQGEEAEEGIEVQEEAMKIEATLTEVILVEAATVTVEATATVEVTAIEEVIKVEDIDQEVDINKKTKKVQAITDIKKDMNKINTMKSPIDLIIKKSLLTKSPMKKNINTQEMARSCHFLSTNHLKCTTAEVGRKEDRLIKAHRIKQIEDALPTLLRSMILRYVTYSLVERIK